MKPADGIGFEITAQPGVPKATLEAALRRAGAPLAGMGISGWIVLLDVDAPRITPHTQDGFPWEACRLVAHCRARRADSSLDLGTVPAVSSKVDGAMACEAAADTLAEAVIYRLVSSLRKGTP